MYLKPAGEVNTFDVFLGDGWSNWARVRVNEDGTVTPIKGLPLNSHFLSHVQSVVSAVFYRDLRGKKR